MEPAATPKRREFLFLQGLAGPFFSKLGTALLHAGHGVHRVNFHGGDRLFWRNPGAVDYRLGESRWPDFLDNLLTERRVTDLVLFGDCRPLHRAAVTLAGRRGLQVHVFEEGYMRPDWVTLEAGGVNGLSSLPRDPGYYLEAARSLPAVPEAAGIPSSFRRRAIEDIAYNFAAAFSIPLYPGYRTHRPIHPMFEYVGWGARLLRRPAARRRSAAVMQQLAAHGPDYFVFPLQLDCDYQIRIHSPYPGMLAAIEHVLGSFAAHAPANTILLVKAHPLDNGLRDWGRVVRSVAARLGLGARLLFVEEGNIGPMVCGALGVVTVNSTTGTLALAHGVPVATLGQAVYDIPRVTHQAGLDAFWTAPEAPDPAVFEAMRRVLVHRCMIRGGFFSDEGLQMLVDAAVARIERADTAMHLAPATARAAGRPGMYPAPAAG